MKIFELFEGDYELRQRSTLAQILSFLKARARDKGGSGSYSLAAVSHMMSNAGYPVDEDALSQMIQASDNLTSIATELGIIDEPELDLDSEDDLDLDLDSEGDDEQEPEDDYEAPPPDEEPEEDEPMHTKAVSSDQTVSSMAKSALKRSESIDPTSMRSLLELFRH